MEVILERADLLARSGLLRPVREKDSALPTVLLHETSSSSMRKKAEREDANSEESLVQRERIFVSMGLVVWW